MCMMEGLWCLLGIKGLMSGGQVVSKGRCVMSEGEYMACFNKFVVSEAGSRWQMESF